MASKRDIFFEYLSSSGKMDALDTGSMIGWYDWTETFGSNEYILNSKYENPQQDTIIDSLYVNADNFPLYQLSTGEGYTHESGRGVFDSQTVFQKVGHKFYGTEWMSYLEFDYTNAAAETNASNKGRILFTSMENPIDSSGFAIGINGANKLYFHYAHTGGYTETVTANSIELKNKNLISIVYRNSDEKSVTGAIYNKQGNVLQNVVSPKGDSSYVQITQHDISEHPAAAENQAIHKVRFENVPSVNSSTLNVGGYPTTDSWNIGFSGYITNAVFFSGISMNQKALNLGASAFALSSYQGEQTGRQEYYEVVTTGSGILTTQVTGTGITGYERAAVAGAAGTTVYIQSGVTGELTGQVAVFADGASGSYGGSGSINDTLAFKMSGDLSGVKTYYERVITPEASTLDSEAVSGYSPASVVFSESIDSNETIEIISFTGNPVGVGTNLKATLKGFHGGENSQEGYRQSSVNSFTSSVNFYQTANGNKEAPAYMSIREEVPYDPYLSGVNLYENGTLLKASNPDSKGVLKSESGDYFMTEGRHIYIRESKFKTNSYESHPTTSKKTAIVSSGIDIPVAKESVVTYDNIYKDGMSSNLDGVTVSADYVHGSGPYTYTGSSYINKWVFLNGLKLISGINYTVAGNVVTLNRDKIDAEAGNLSFVPINEFAHTGLYSGSGAYIDAGFPLSKAQVYRNGARQIKGINYEFSNPNSLLNSDVRIERPDDLLYISGFFNE